MKWLQGIGAFFLILQNTYAGAHLLQVASDGSAFERRWTTPNVSWRLKTSGAPSGAQQLIEDAFDLWADVDTSTATHTYAGATSATEPTLDGYSDFFFNIAFTGLGIPSQVIALTMINSETNSSTSDPSEAVIEEADIVVNPAFSGDWTTSASADPTDLDVMEIVAHEIGHLYGMAHSFLIDAMMYPSKPDVSTDADLLALFRAPKRTLSSDDKSWISRLYPTTDFRSSTSEVHGKIYYDGVPYVGAHVVAVKLGESDLDYDIISDSGTDSLVVKGLKNVSAFSEANGDFKILGLEPGNYSLVVQDSNPFLSFTTANVSSYLSGLSSDDLFPTQFWSNPDCANEATVSDSNLTTLASQTESFTLAANQSYCQVELEAHISENRCGARAGVLSNACEKKSGFCSLEIPSEIEEPKELTIIDYFSEHPGILLIMGGSFLFLILARSRGRKERERDQKLNEYFHKVKNRKNLDL